MILAVVVVAVLVGGGAIAVISMNNKGGESPDIGAALPVYGNANLDAEINGDDLSIIQNIIDKKDGYTISAYPFADACKDGEINDKDADVVKKIINKEGTTVYHLNYYNDGAVDVKTKVADTKWPCEDLMVTYNSIMFIMASLGLDDKVVGATSAGKGNYDAYMYEDMMKDVEPITVAYDAQWNGTLDTSSISSIMTKHTKAHTVFVSGYGNYDANNESAIEALGCDVVRLCESNPARDETLASVLLAGFLTQTMDKAKDLTKLYADIWDKCDAISKALPDSDKEKFAVMVATPDTVAGTSNQHNYKCRIAGGASLIGAASQDIDTWILEDEYNKSLDKIILMTWSNENNGHFFGDHNLKSSKLIADFTEHPMKLGDKSVWTLTDAWANKEVYYVYGDFPTAMDILARGYAMYPDYYGDLYKDSCDKLLSLISGGKFADKGLKFVFSLSDMESY